MSPSSPARPRTILHVDMDAFYASVEQLDHPDWRGKPVIVGADPKEGRGRGVVAACSYEARVFGVRSALPISHAWKLCRHGVFVRPRMERYSEASRKVFALLRDLTDLVEPLSIDEAFLDVTGSDRLFGGGAAIGRAIKERVRSALGLVASVGVAPNKFVAKVASDLGKPDGFVVVQPGEAARFLAPLPLSRLWGVGPRTEEKLRKMGLERIGDVARLRPDDLRAALGEQGPMLGALARGEDDRPVLPEAEAKSLGAETTFDEDTGDSGVVRRTLLSLADRVASRLRAERLAAGGITLKFRDEGFRTVTRSLSLAAPTDAADEVYAAALELLERVPFRGQKVRLLGITAIRLQGPEKTAAAQLDLFSPPETAKRERHRQLAKSVDEIRRQFGEGAIRRAALLDGEKEK